MNPDKETALDRWIHQHTYLTGLAITIGLVLTHALPNLIYGS